MKRLVYYIFSAALFSCIIFVSCSRIIEEESLNNVEDRVLVKLNFTGEVNVNESPMTRAFSSGDMLGIQVKEGSNYYAYGLFDDPSKVSIYMHSGKSYSFECCLVKNGKNILSSEASGKPHTVANYPVYTKVGTNSSGLLLDDGGYRLPFLRGPGGTIAYTYTSSTTTGSTYTASEKFSYDYRITPLTNRFVYTSATYFNRLQYGQLTTGDSKTYPKASVFYGRLNNVKAGTDLSIPIELKSGSFGVKLTILGITDGAVTVTIKNNAQTFHTNANISQDTEFGITKWCFYDLASAYQYADNYAENFTVGVVWNRGVGVTQDLGTKTVQFKRNVVNHVKIKLSTATRSSDFQIALDEPEIEGAAYEILYSD